MMKRFLPALTLIGILGVPASAQDSEAMSPNVHTLIDGQFVPPGSTTKFFFSGDFTNPSELHTEAIDAMHRLSDPGQWLFSVTANDPSGLAGNLQLPAAPDDFLAKGDIVFFDGYDGSGTFSLFFCGFSPGTDVNPARGNYDIDAVYLEGDDLIVGFEVATDITEVTGEMSVTTTYESGDLARLSRTGPSCSEWDHVGKRFDATGKIEDAARIIGAAPASRPGGGIVFAFDRATCTCPPDCPVTTCPGDGETSPTWVSRQLVQWKDQNFTQSEALLPDWPQGSLVNALGLSPPTCPGMGDTSPDVSVCAAKWTSNDGSSHSRFEWVPSAGVDSYNVYRGLFSEDPLTNVECLTSGEFQNIQFVDTTDPNPGDGYYYLVAEVVGGVEGTLGKDSFDVERSLSGTGPCQ